MILRRWTGRIRTGDTAAYVDYIAGTGGADYASVDGNLGWQMLSRDLGNGETEITTLSWWRSIEAIRGFAGDDYARARYYPEDDRYLLDRATFVEHHEVAAGSAIPG